MFQNFSGQRMFIGNGNIRRRGSPACTGATPFMKYA